MPTIYKEPMVTVIAEQIKILAELQKIDSEIYILKKEVSEHPAQQKKIESDLNKKKASLKAAEEELRTAQLKQKEKEGDLQVKEEKIKKLQGQLYQLKSNKEYSAMEVEIKGLKADNSLLEEDILRLLDVVDQARAKVAQEKERLAAEEKAAKDQLEALKKSTAALEAQVAGFEEKRKTYTPNVELKLLSQYEKILKNREGIALVPVRNNACGGCHLGLPPQAVNEIQIQDKLMVCESCARILYWAP